MLFAASILSNLEQQCFDLKNCLQQLKDEEHNVRESLMSVQNLSETLTMEKNDLSQYLKEVIILFYFLILNVCIYFCAILHVIFKQHKKFKQHTLNCKKLLFKLCNFIF